MATFKLFHQQVDECRSSEGFSAGAAADARRRGCVLPSRQYSRAFCVYGLFPRAPVGVTTAGTLSISQFPSPGTTLSTLRAHC